MVRNEKVPNREKSEKGRDTKVQFGAPEWQTENRRKHAVTVTPGGGKNAKNTQKVVKREYNGREGHSRYKSQLLRRQRTQGKENSIQSQTKPHAAAG